MLAQLWRCRFQHLSASFQYLERVYKKNGDRLFSRDCSNRIRNNGFKLKEDLFTLNIRKNFFTIRVVRHWQWATQG